MPPRPWNPCSSPDFAPDPEYTPEARKAHIQGVVRLWISIGPDGKVSDVHVEKKLGYGLDEKAVQAVQRWKFGPAPKDDQPVAVKIEVEVTFSLYK